MNIEKHLLKSTKKSNKLSHFKWNEDARIICDASKKGPCFQQSQNDGVWRPISFASRFLTDFETKYSINELEPLALVWAFERFKNDVYGVQLIVSDHKSFMSLLKWNR